MIGGLGPESTLDYYRLLIQTFLKENKGQSNPEIIIYSMDLYKILNLIKNNEWDTLTDCLVTAINALYRSGADFGFISANTPHIVFDRVKKLSPIPLISIVEANSDFIEEQGIKRVGLLGTKFTMESDFYQKVFDKKSIYIILPNQKDQNYIQNKLMTEIELGEFLDETRDGLLEIINRMLKEDSIEGIILGCTELPLILTESKFGIPFFNTTKIHIDRIIQYCI